MEFAGCAVIAVLAKRVAASEVALSPFAAVTMQRYFTPLLVFPTVTETEAVFAPVAPLSFHVFPSELYCH